MKYNKLLVRFFTTSSEILLLTGNEKDSYSETQKGRLEMLKQLFQRIIMVAAILTVMLCTSSYAGICEAKGCSAQTAARHHCCTYPECREPGGTRM